MSPGLDPLRRPRGLRGTRPAAPWVRHLGCWEEVASLPEGKFCGSLTSGTSALEAAAWGPLNQEIVYPSDFTEKETEAQDNLRAGTNEQVGLSEGIQSKQVGADNALCVAWGVGRPCGGSLGKASWRW